MTTLTIDVATTPGAVEDLASAWETLWLRLPERSPFQSPAWLLPWWSHYGTDRPVIATLRADDRLLALLPAYVLDEGPERKLLPIGAGITDYLDALIAPDAPADAASRLVAAALAAASDITSCDLFDLPPHSDLRHAEPPPGWHRHEAHTNPCPVLQIPPDATDLRAVIPAGTHRKLRMNRHRATRRGGHTTEIADTQSFARLFDTLVQLHGARWTAQGEPGVLADPTIQRFHRDAGPRLLDAGLLRLQSLSFDGVTAAVIMALSAPPDRLFFYLSGFDAAFAFESPGTLLLGQMIEAAIRDGVREIHFLRGREPYKYAWGAVDRLNATRHFVPA